MKTQIFLLSVLFSVCLAGCNKEESYLTSASEELLSKNSVPEDQNKEMKKGYGDIACAVFDSEGNYLCLGIAYQTPNGKHKWTKCECLTLSASAEFPLELKAEQFKEMWNDSIGQEKLRAVGCYDNVFDKVIDEK